MPGLLGGVSGLFSQERIIRGPETVRDSEQDLNNERPICHRVGRLEFIINLLRLSM